MATPINSAAMLQRRAWRCQPATAPPTRHRPLRRCLVVHAGLLDLLRRGGSSGGGNSLVTDADGEALKQWMMDRGLPQQKLAAASTPGSGRGLVATQGIGKGELLLRIPPQLMITPDAAQQQSSLREILEEQPLPAWSVLALWLAEARAAGAAGQWWPYVQLLPERTGCVLEWPEQHVDWLRGSQLYEAAREIRQAAETSWREMQPLLAAAEQRGLALPPGAFSRASLQWAFSMLLSRLVRLDSLAQQEVLLPFADLLNHSCTAGAHLDWSGAESAVVLQAERRYAAGEEVHISYGQKTSGELLLSYGFCPEPGSNPHDGCKMSMQLSSSSSSSKSSRQAADVAAWKAEALQAHGFSAAGQLFPLRMQAAPYELVHYAAFAAAQVGSQEEAAELARQLFERADFPPALQQTALEAVIKACQAAVKGYPSSLEADRAELDRLIQEQQQQQQQQLAAAPAASASSDQQQQQAERQRRRQVLQVLVYERQVLNRTVFILQQELKDVKRMAAAAAAAGRR